MALFSLQSYNASYIIHVTILRGFPTNEADRRKTVREAEWIVSKREIS